MMPICLLCVSLFALPAEQVLVSPEQLGGLEDALVVDVRSEADYRAGHIPGAVNLCYEELSEIRGGVKNLAKPSRVLIGILAEKGIDPYKHIVVYTKVAVAKDVTQATRVFWILEYLSYPKVSLLDGGLNRWIAEEHPVEEGPGIAPAPLNRSALALELRPRAGLLATKAQMAAALAEEGVVGVDARPAEYYAGEKTAEYVRRAGHIAGSVNRPVLALVEGPHFVFRKGEDLAAAPEAADGKKLILYCNSGQSATLAYVGCRLSGMEETPVYDGSMAEWSTDPDAPVEK